MRAHLIFLIAIKATYKPLKSKKSKQVQEHKENMFYLKKRTYFAFHSLMGPSKQPKHVRTVRAQNLQIFGVKGFAVSFRLSLLFSVNI